MLLTARALALDDIDRDASRAAVLEAVKLAPDLVPAAALAGRRLAEAGELRKARKILERHGPPIRIPISPRPMPICASATARASG